MKEKATRQPDFYLAYLNSSSWQMRRNRALKSTGYRCQRCGAKRHLQVHHVTYERLGAERDEDLEVLCADCHESHHIEAASQSAVGVYVKVASEALREHPFADIGTVAEEAKLLCVKYKLPYDGHQLDRVLDLLSGSRIKRRAPKQVAIERGGPPDPQVISAQEAHEILCRLGIQELTGLLKPMPSLEPTPDEQQAHVDKIRTQALDYYRSRRLRVLKKRQTIEERLAEIFK